MRITIIGGGGFIGSHASEALLNQFHEVTILDQAGAPNLTKLDNLGAKILIGNFLDDKSLENSMKNAEVVIHVAATTVPKSSNENPAYDMETNLVGSLKIFQAAISAKVRKIVITSSGGTVYGIPKITPIPEDHPTNPISSYGIIKLTIEKYAQLYNHLYGLDYAILRISNAYGPRQIPGGAQGLIPTVIKRVLDGQEVLIWGDGSVIRDYIHVEDVAAAIQLVSTHDFPVKLVNIGTEIGYSVNEVLTKLQTILKKHFPVRYIPSEKYDVPINILDCTLAHEKLNWFPLVSFEHGLSQLVGLFS